MISDGKAFDQMNPPKAVTDPQGLGALYPKHLHKAGVSADGGPLYIVVGTPEEEADAVTDGWLLVKPNPHGEPEAGPPPGSGPAPTHPRRK
jgi:hypothetical protein